MDELQTSARHPARDALPVTRSDLRVIHKRFDKGSERMKTQDDKIAALTKSQDENNAMTREVLEIVEMGRSVFRFFEKLGRAMRWIGRKLYWLARVGGVVAAGVMAIYGLVNLLLHGGSPPKLP